MKEKYNYLDRLPVVTQEELERDFDTVLEKVKTGMGPVLIRGKDGNDVVMFDWQDYKQRFAALYSAEEFAAIEEACRQAEEG